MWEDRKVYPVNDSQVEGERFINNPFQSLKAANFPTANEQAKLAKSSSLPTDTDSELFLKAFLNLPPSPSLPSTTRESGFLLADQCAIPELDRKKMKKKKDSAKPTPPPDPNQNHEDENASFLLAMRKTRPLAGKGREITRKPTLRENPAHNPAFAELLEAQMEFTLLYSDEYLEGRVANLDELIMNRLRSGQMSPEAHLDLHGLNAEQAFESLRFFIRDAWFKSLRVVLLVPGRGKNSPAGHGVLRRKVQEWLTHEPFKRVVLAFCTAQPHDGGPGSIYVLLRKFRKKGHISWNRLPADADLLDF